MEYTEPTSNTIVVDNEVYTVRQVTRETNAFVEIFHDNEKFGEVELHHTDNGLVRAKQYILNEKGL